MRAEEEYVPERDEEEEDARDVIHELEDDKTSAEEVEEEEEEREVIAQVIVGEVLRRASVVETVRDMLAHKPVDRDHLTTLSDHEREALEFLQTIIDGRTRSGAFVYAEQRLEQLNHVLADLQPLMSVGLVEGLEQTLHEVVDGFDELRKELELLEEAQAELQHLAEEKAGDEDDDDDEDDQGDDDQGDGEEAAGEQPVDQGTSPEGDADKKPPLWERLWNRKKPPPGDKGGDGKGGDGGGGGGGGGQGV